MNILTKNKIVFLFAMIMVNSYAQEKSNIETIRNLQKKYMINSPADSLLAFNSDGLFDPKYRENFKCVRMYNIPDSLLLTIYPFNADSIVIYCPENPGDCSNIMKRYSKMGKEEIVIFTDMLYNYDFMTYMDIYCYSTGYSSGRPDIALYFYNNQEIDTLSIHLFHMLGHEDHVFYESTFRKDDRNSMIWGNPCDDSIEKMINFFLSNYGYQIKRCVRRDPEYIPIPIK